MPKYGDKIYLYSVRGWLSARRGEVPPYPTPSLADEYWFGMANFDKNTGRMAFAVDERRAGKAFRKNLVKAINAAKSARFEHGKSH